MAKPVFHPDQDVPALKSLLEDLRRFNQAISELIPQYANDLIGYACHDNLIKNAPVTLAAQIALARLKASILEDISKNKGAMALVTIDYREKAVAALDKYIYGLEIALRPGGPEDHVED